MKFKIIKCQVIHLGTTFRKSFCHKTRPQKLEEMDEQEKSEGFFFVWNRFQATGVRWDEIDTVISRQTKFSSNVSEKVFSVMKDFQETFMLWHQAPIRTPLEHLSTMSKKNWFKLEHVQKRTRGRLVGWKIYINQGGRLSSSVFSITKYEEQEE